MFSTICSILENDMGSEKEDSAFCLELLEFLILKKRISNFDKLTLINSALCSDNEVVVEYLIKTLGENFSVEDYKEICEKIIIKASSKGELDTIKYFISKGIRGDFSGSYCLKVVATYGYYEIFKFFIDECKCDVKIRKRDIFLSAIDCACYNCDQKYEESMKIINFIINKNLSCGICYGEALCRALCFEKIDLIKLLIKSGANCTYHNNRPIENFCINNHRYSEKNKDEILNLLLMGGADPNSNDGALIFHFARNGDINSLEKIIKYGAKVDLKDNYTMQIASSLKDEELALFLMKSGVSINEYEHLDKKLKNKIKNTKTEKGLVVPLFDKSPLIRYLAEKRLEEIENNKGKENGN